MTKLVINQDKCKGCGLCVANCPKKILILDTTNLNSKGYSPVAITDESKCISCAFCATVCPDLVLEVFKDDKK